MRPVIVTRPAPAGPRLIERLRLAHHAAHWWPAFVLESAGEEAGLAAKLQRLADYDLAIFVSVPAVEAVAGHLTSAWPRTTTIGCVGPGTAMAAARLPVIDAAQIVAPTGDGGAESLWQSLCDQRVQPRKVLLLRAEHGRDWLIDTLQDAGATVDTLTVYRRRAAKLPDAEREHAERWIKSGAVPVTVFSSSEAVSALDTMVADALGRDWLRSGHAVATHPRIGQRLRAAGYARVHVTGMDDASIVATIESLRD